MWRDFPTWGGGMLVGYEGNRTAGPVIYMVDRDGRSDDILFTIPDGRFIEIMNLAVSPGGEIAIIGGVLSSDGRRTTFLARIAADRKQQTITRLWPYLPKAVTPGPDNTVWTIGNLTNEDNTRDVAFHVLRRFDPAGKMLGSTTLRVRGSSGDEGVSFFQSSKDRVGWYTIAGEYIEFAPDGSEIGRYDGPDGSTENDTPVWLGTSMALSEENDVVVGRFARGKAEFLLLDRDKHLWTPVSIGKEHAPKWARLLGFDGTTLVITPDSGRLSRFHTK